MRLAWSSPRVRGSGHGAFGVNDQVAVLLARGVLVVDRADWVSNRRVELGQVVFELFALRMAHRCHPGCRNCRVTQRDGGDRSHYWMCWGSGTTCRRAVAGSRCALIPLNAGPLRGLAHP